MKKVLLVVAILLAAITVSAMPIQPSAAKQRATRFLQTRTINSPRHAAPSSNSDQEPTLLYAAASTTLVGQAAYYIYDSPSGYVVVSGDDRAEEILMYGDAPLLDISHIPANMRAWLESYHEQLDWLLAHPDAQVQTYGQRVPHRADTTVIEPLLTALWDQSAPYNWQCPLVSGKNCLTGCPATSLAMTLHYWKYPIEPTPTIPAYQQEGKTYEALPPITLDWDNILDDYSGNYTTEQGNAVAALMRYVGQAEHMDYGIDASGIDADSVQCMVDACVLLGYDSTTVRLVKKNSSYEGGRQLYTDSEWEEIMIAELQEGRPITYCALSSSGGHAFNVDGYDGDGKYHVNFGWSGEGNAYCALNAFSYSFYTFNRYQQMVIGVQPPAEFFGPTIKTRPNQLAMHALEGETDTATFVLTGSVLTDDVTLTLDDQHGAYTITPTTIDAEQSQQGVNVTITFTPKVWGDYPATITCSSPNAKDKVITITGVGQLEKHDPKVLPADSSAISLSSFRADWTDTTPAKNVASYTLEVSQQRLLPTAKLIDEANWSAYSKETKNHASDAEQYLPEGWTYEGSLFYLDGGCVSPGRTNTITTRPYDLSDYGKITVVVTAKAFSASTMSRSNITLTTTSQLDSAQTIPLTTSYETYTVCFNAADSDQLVFTAGYYPNLRDIKVYAGTFDESTIGQQRAAEQGNRSYRLITGITPDQSYIVDGLAGGTYFYRVKGIYIDGTESDWRNVERVTLEGEARSDGDVNGDGIVSVADINAVINVILTGNYSVWADVNGDGTVSIADINAIIDIMLTQ